MKRGAERDLTRIGWLDYVLMSIGSCLAVYSAGMSIQLPSLSYFCVVLVIVGTCVSYAVRVLSFKSNFIKLDALFYAAAVICAIFFSSELRAIMPENGFPREIAAAGWLSWMLILGSFATWQDSTLLFQAIPALALFGLIGCYDTYRNVTLAFYAFLICLATLFARAHGREMLRKSADSGYFTRGLAPGTPIPSVETTPGLALKLKQGPWRWVAGPEWALLSALCVVLISLLGAPVIRSSVAGVAGFVHINPPSVRPRSAQVSQATADVVGQSVKIGRPFTKTISRPLIEVKLDRFRYLRSETYNTYTGHGWQNTSVADPSGQPASTLTDVMQSEMKDKESFSFDLLMLKPMRLLPVPPEVVSLSVDGGGANLLPEGTYELISTSSDNLEIKGKSVEISPNVKPTTRLFVPEMDPYLDLAKIPARVQQLALNVTQNSHNDYEKATAIRHEIENRIVYNIEAAETPADRDPVDYALFDQKEGYCTAFASAMVLMARSVGIPARYVQGYLPDERRHERDGPYIIADADYHAWAELSFKDAGWVIFDPTIGAAYKPGEGLGDTVDPRQWYQKGFLNVLFNLLAGLVSVAVLFSAYLLVRHYRRPSSARSALDGVYVSFSRRIERVIGRRRNVGQTATEFLVSAKASLGDSYAEAEALNDRFVKAMYASGEVSVETVAQMREDVNRFKKGIRPLPRAATRGEA